MIGSSNRGGRRVRKRTVDQAGLDEKDHQINQLPQTDSAIDEAENDHIQFQADSLPPSNPRPSWPAEYGTSTQANGNTLQELNPPSIMLDPALQAADASARYVWSLPCRCGRPFALPHAYLTATLHTHPQYRTMIPIH